MSPQEGNMSNSRQLLKRNVEAKTSASEPSACSAQDLFDAVATAETSFSEAERAVTMMDDQLEKHI
jgi:hypothetical protein